MKKLALIAIFGMFVLGTSFLAVNAQNQPTGAPDTSVRSKPAVVTPSTPVQKPATQVSTQKTSGRETGLLVAGIIALVVIGGVAVVLTRKKDKK